MTYLLGVDEAGYGPNLGPLVIGATLWRAPDELAGADWYNVLRSAIACEPRAAANGKIAIADSKLLYKPGGGLALLERGVLAALAVCGRAPQTWRGAWSRLAPDCESDFDGAPWHDGYDRELPCDATIDEVACAAAALAECLRACGVELLTVRSCAVFPERFNSAVRQHGNKSAALSKLTLELVRTLIEPLDDEAIIVRCDKHGGRDRYGPLLQETFPEYLVEVRHEGRAQSKYAWGPPGRRVEIDFSVGGESFLPSALASMTAKYLRELAMQAFNRYWLAHLPHLKPTAGYPLDARRFKAEIEPAQRELGIADGLLWRER